MGNLRYRLLSPFRVIVVFFIVFILLPTFASPEEIYKLDRMWPTEQQPWYFAHPRGIVIDDQGYVYVTDSDNNRLLKFTKDGHFVDSWGTLRAVEIDIDSNGFVYVADYHNNRVQKFTIDGQFVTNWDNKG